MQIITVDENKCIGCNACVRVCPVHANITRLREGTEDEFFTTVDQTACINCGECVKACKHGARNYNDNIDDFVKAYEDNENLTIIVAPAVRTSFPGRAWMVLLQWIREHGNVKIYDVGFGADICTYMHNKYLERYEDLKILTQPCPAVVNYVQKYKPELIKNLSPVMSPAGCMGAWLKKYKHDNNKMFMFSPCIAKTSEAIRENVFDGNVTFKHLEQYVERKGINWNSNVDFEFDESEGGIGRMYPMPGGLRDTLLMMNNHLVIRTAEGPQTLYDRLSRYADTPDSRKPDILDVLNCEYGCNHGTALPEQAASLLEVENIMDDISAQSVAEVKGGFLGFGKMKRFKDFDKTLMMDDFLTKYKKHPVERKVQDYDRVFNDMHKTDPASREINCTACGYKSCKEMAYAIACGLNVKENCVYYLKKSLKDSYLHVKSLYDACVKEIYNINSISGEVKKVSENVLVNTDDIGDKSSTLSSNITRLQKLSETCLNYYKNKTLETLTSADFDKMKQFISAIGSMANGYNDVAQDFEKTSDNIHEDIATVLESITKLTQLSSELYTLVGGQTSIVSSNDIDKGSNGGNGSNGTGGNSGNGGSLYATHELPGKPKLNKKTVSNADSVTEVPVMKSEVITPEVLNKEDIERERLNIGMVASDEEDKYDDYNDDDDNPLGTYMMGSDGDFDGIRAY